MTFEEFIDSLLAIVDDRHPGVEPFLRASTVRALGPPLSRLRAEWTEATTTFTTVDATTEYDSSVVAAFPANVGDIDLLMIDASDTPEQILRAAPLTEVRALSYLAPQTPTVWCWRHRKLILGPPTREGIVLRLDYTIDARRDESSGALIATTDTTTTNPWFRLGEGHDVLRCRVLADYFGSYARNADLAAVYSNFFEAARGESRSQLQNRRDDGVVAPAVWPGETAWPSERRRWGG